MPNIKFVSYEAFPEDQYTREVVYLCIDEKYRVAYLRKPAKNGGLFWSVPTFSVTKNGMKEYYESFLQDSLFLDKDIKAYLESRAWEKKAVEVQATPVSNEDVPF